MMFTCALIVFSFIPMCKEGLVLCILVKLNISEYLTYHTIYPYIQILPTPHLYKVELGYQDKLNIFWKNSAYHTTIKSSWTILSALII